MSDPAVRATASDGARVGAAIGVLALAIGLSAGGWWLPAAIVAGAVAGAWAGPRVVVDGPIKSGVVVAGAAIATFVGAVVVSAAVVVGSSSIRNDGFASLLGAWLSRTLVALLSVGWLAMLLLLPVTGAAMAIVRGRAARANPHGSTVRRGAWIGGLVVGVASAVLALSFPVVGYEIGLLFTVGALLSRATLCAVGGLFVGFGSAWVGVIANAALRCDLPSCVSPDLAPWLAAGVTVLVVGVASSVVAAGRR
jgi:hypothetical protein